MKSMLSLGDSYTTGTGVSPQESWPVQLAMTLRLRGVYVHDPLIIAQNGWTTADLADGIRVAGPQGPFDLVTLLIGVNDQYSGRPIKEYRPAYTGLLAQAVAFACGNPQHVLVLSIPDWGVTPFAAGRDRARIASELDTYNAINQETAERNGVHYIDITPLTRRAGANPAMLAPDGLHPSGKMYALWVELILEIFELFLKGNLKESC